jgi:hypothetical protein
MFPTDTATRLPLDLTQDQEQCDEYTQDAHSVRDKMIGTVHTVEERLITYAVQSEAKVQSLSQG